MRIQPAAKLRQWRDQAAFLKDRLDEMWAAADAAVTEASDYEIVGTELAQQHFDNWPPLHVLREVTAQHKIVEAYVVVAEEVESGLPSDLLGDAITHATLATLGGVIAQLSQVYADHEDFVPSWLEV